MHRRLLGSLIVVAMAGCTPRNRDPKPAAQDRGAEVTSGLRPNLVVKGSSPVRFALRDRMAHYHVPGVTIAVVDSGRIVWARGFGLKEAGTTDSVTPETLFQAASISKPVSATAMLRLVQEGKLALDVPINQNLKSWHLPENRFTAKEELVFTAPDQGTMLESGTSLTFLPGKKGDIDTIDLAGYKFTRKAK